MSHTVPLKTPLGQRPTPASMDAQVLANRPHTDRYWRLRLKAPSIATRAQPGQFVMITAARTHESGPVLPRPMAIYTRSSETGVIDILYGVVGDGTRALSTFVPGESLVVTGPLGQGFVIRPETTRILLIGRGIGTCSLTTVAQDFVESRTELIAVVSGRSRLSVIGADTFGKHGARAIWEVNDADGTSRVDVLRERLLRKLSGGPPQQILTSGSERLAHLSAHLATRWEASVQVSIEAHMACGMGYCHGCTAGFVDSREPSLVCRDGPVFELDTTHERTD